MKNQKPMQRAGKAVLLRLLQLSQHGFCVHIISRKFILHVQATQPHLKRASGVNESIKRGKINSLYDFSGNLLSWQSQLLVKRTMHLYMWFISTDTIALFVGSGRPTINSQTHISPWMTQHPLYKSYWLQLLSLSSPETMTNCSTSVPQKEKSAHCVQSKHMDTSASAVQS